MPSVDFMTFQAEDATPRTVSIKYSAYVAVNFWFQLIL